MKVVGHFVCPEDNAMQYDGIEGKVAIVTGSGGGIGEAYAKGLAAQGARVVVAEIRQDDGERVAEEIRNQGGDAHFAAADVGSEASTLALAEEVKKSHGGIDLLVNNVHFHFARIRFSQYFCPDHKKSGSYNTPTN
ncbi:SDR family NAD(P)-dependent oxidoreductase [Myxococcota bacterium]|nr:SDR family NAD(P)-dependent oxidoreductase [Myxococcota bacterium]